MLCKSRSAEKLIHSCLEFTSWHVDKFTALPVDSELSIRPLRIRVPQHIGD